MDSFKKADIVLFAAFPNAEKMPGAGPGPKEKAIEKINRFRARVKRVQADQEERIYFHKDYLRYRKGDPEVEEDPSLEGVLQGHRDVKPITHKHRTIAHINVAGYTIESEDLKVTIMIIPKKG